MNRVVMFGIAALVAIVGLSLLGSEKEAVAGWGCHGGNVCAPTCGGNDCGGGLFARHRARKCSGRDTCSGGLFARHRARKCSGGLFARHRARKCCGVPAPSCCGAPEPACCEPAPTCCAPEPACDSCGSSACGGCGAAPACDSCGSAPCGCGSAAPVEEWSAPVEATEEAPEAPAADEASFNLTFVK